MATITGQTSSVEGTNPGKLVLYSYWRSSCAWRVRIALKLKGLSYEYKAVNLLKGEQYSDEYTKINPVQFVPSLVDGDTVISDSLAIILYLEDKYPEHSVFPKDLRMKAISLQAATIVESTIQPLQNTSVLKIIEEKLGKEEQLNWARSFIERGFTALEKLLKNVAQKYCVGDQVTMADVYLVPQLYNAGRYNVDMTKFPVLQRIYSALVDLPEFQETRPEKQPDAVA
eukprot:TRINITY_DN3886_c0_g1_i1.p1 TRINITY_DN3886_c0_g1~~TRINITY_DN3886_c0_g1_i1.p1  ORF type:complete len:228 (-),score=50.13 TRINITY_DN3886_c0_g1_i1:297-980(-)